MKIEERIKQKTAELKTKLNEWEDSSKDSLDHLDTLYTEISIIIMHLSFDLANTYVRHAKAYYIKTKDRTTKMLELKKEAIELEKKFVKGHAEDQVNFEIIDKIRDEFYLETEAKALEVIINTAKQCLFAIKMRIDKLKQERYETIKQT